MSAIDSYGLKSNQFCLPWTVMIGSAAGFVCHGQLWLVKQPVLSGHALVNVNY